MRQTQYHLRPNKAVDRSIFIDTVRKLNRCWDLSEYTYYGLGGPLLEDFRLLYQLDNRLDLVSFESRREIFKRQQFHRPCASIELNNMNMSDFITNYNANGEKSVFWLDFNGLSLKNIVDFQKVIQRVEEGSLVKMSVRAHPLDYFGRPDSFNETFGRFLRVAISNIPTERTDYVKLIQDMLLLASEDALAPYPDTVFQLLHSFFYSDSDKSTMLSVSGVVVPHRATQRIKNAYGNSLFSNFDWNMPKEIDLPLLSTKERLRLETLLSDDDVCGDSLFDELGYRLESNEAVTKLQLEQYALYHRHYPYFMKVSP